MPMNRPHKRRARFLLIDDSAAPHADFIAFNRLTQARCGPSPTEFRYKDLLICLLRDAGTAAKETPTTQTGNAGPTMTKAADYAVADIGLADFGRKEIAIAETEMPGLMATRAEYRRHSTAEGRAHRRLAAHDDPDGGADRDPEGARRRRPLGLLQHLFDPGPRRRGDRRHRHAGLRGQGREPQGLLGLHPPHLRMGGRRLAQHDPRRRRRRHAADPSRPARRAGRRDVPRHGVERGRGSALRGDQGAAQDASPAGTAQRRRRSAASPKRRPPACIGSI